MFNFKQLFILVVFSLYAPHVYSEDLFLSLMRKPVPFMDTPANTTLITREDIENSNADNVLELLENKKGIFVKDLYGNGKSVDVDIRGFGETSLMNVLVLVNGTRLNSIDMSTVNWSMIPVSNIEKIEIINGGGGVLYGDNTSGGIINIITKTPEKSDFMVSAKYGSFSENGLEARINRILSGRVSLNLGLNNSSSAGFRKNNNSSDGNVNFGLSAKLSGSMNNSFKINYHRDEFGMPGGISEADYTNGNLTGTLTPDDNAATPYDLLLQETFTSKNSAGESTVDINCRTRKSQSNSPSFFFIPDPYDTRNTFTTQLTLKHSFDTFILNNPNYFQVGADIFSSDYKIETFKSAERTALNEETKIRRNTNALYLLDKADLAHNLSVTAGVRAESLNNKFEVLSSSMSDMIDGTVSASNISLEWLYLKKLNFTIDYTNSYRFPKTDEYYSIFSRLLNKNLKPQSNSQVSLNIKYLFNRDYYCSLSLYDLSVNNEIAYDYAAMENINSGAASHRGAEFELSSRHSGSISSRVSLAFTQAKYTAGAFNGREIPLVPQVEGGINISCLVTGNVTVNLAETYVGERWTGSDFTNILNKLSPYNLANLSFILKKDNFNFKTGINNLLDSKYATGFFGVYYPAPGRNLFMSASVVL